MWYDSSWFVGILSGVIASFSFFIVLLLIKPKIRISSKIAKTKIDGEDVYSVKIVNKSLAMLSNISYALYLKTKINDNVYSLQDIPPRRTPLKYISRYSVIKKNDDYAVRLTYGIDKNKYAIDDDHSLVFSISACHNVTGSTKVAKQEYTLECIQEGKFETGKSMRIT